MEQKKLEFEADKGASRVRVNALVIGRPKVREFLIGTDKYGSTKMVSIDEIDQRQYDDLEVEGYVLVCKRKKGVADGTVPPKIGQIICSVHGENFEVIDILRTQVDIWRFHLEWAAGEEHRLSVKAATKESINKEA